MISLMQGDQYAIEFEIVNEGTVADASCFSDVEIVIGPLRKTLAAHELTFDSGRKVFRFPITQQESQSLLARQVVQVRVKTNAGDVIGVNLGFVDVLGAMSKEVL